MSDKTNAPVIIRRVEEVHEAGHHGGGWKVAYADFMTAMMAFFLLLWILAASDEEKLRGLANYFTPTVSKDGKAAGDGSDLRPLVSPGAMRSGGPGEVGASEPSFGQSSPMRVFDSRLRDQPNTVVVEYAPQSDDEAVETSVAESKPNAVSSDALDAMAGSIEDALMAVDISDDLAESVRVKAEGGALIVEIIDLERRSMFARSSSEISEAARDIIRSVGEVISSMDGVIEIVGHTDATQFAPETGYSNWELSADRANVTRRIMLEGGLDPMRLGSVSGVASTQPANTDDLFAPENRRISIRVVQQ